MNNEKETRGTTRTQESGSTSSTNSASAGANMNPEAEGMRGWAGTEGRTSANRSIGDRLSSQYNSLSQTQKIVGASLLGAAAVGAAYLTRDKWIGKNSWIGQSQSSKAKSKHSTAKAGNESRTTKAGRTAGTEQVR